MSVIITDWNRHVYANRAAQPVVSDRPTSAPAERRAEDDRPKSLGSTIDKAGSGSRGSKSLSSTMDWWNNAESEDTLSEHSLADTDRDSSPIPTRHEDVAREMAGNNEIVGANTDWGALQEQAGSAMASPCFGLLAGPSVPGLVACDADAPVRIADRKMQSLMAARAPSMQTERDCFLSGSMPIVDLKALMEKDSKQDELLTNILATKLSESIHATDVSALKDQNWTRDHDSSFFYGSRPQMSVTDFIARMARYSASSPSCYIVSQIYIDKLRQKLPGLQLHSLTFQRLLLATTMMAAKMFDDFYHSNAVWAKIGGLTTQEMNQIELKILSVLDWNVCISWDEYNRLRLALISESLTAAPTAPNLWVKDVVSPPPHSNPEMRFASHVQVQQPGPEPVAYSGMPRSGSGSQLDQLPSLQRPPPFGGAMQQISQPQFPQLSQAGPGPNLNPASARHSMPRSNSGPDLSQITTASMAYNDSQLASGSPIRHGLPTGFNDPELCRGGPPRHPTGIMHPGHHQPAFQVRGPGPAPPIFAGPSSQGFNSRPSSVTLSRPASVGYSMPLAQPGRPPAHFQVQAGPPQMQMRLF